MVYDRNCCAYVRSCLCTTCVCLTIHHPSPHTKTHCDATTKQNQHPTPGREPLQDAALPHLGGGEQLPLHRPLRAGQGWVSEIRRNWGVRRGAACCCRVYIYLYTYMTDPQPNPPPPPPPAPRRLQRGVRGGAAAGARAAGLLGVRPFRRGLHPGGGLEAGCVLLLGREGCMGVGGMND